MDKLKKYINGDEGTEEEQNGIVGQVWKSWKYIFF